MVTLWIIAGAGAFSPIFVDGVSPAVAFGLYGAFSAVSLYAAVKFVNRIGGQR